MAKFDASELDLINEFLAVLGSIWEGVAKAGLWEGARELKDGLEKEVDSLPTVKDRFYFKSELPLPALREVEKKGLKEGIRIMKMERTADGVSVSLTFSGYNDLGKPNILVARSLTKGTTIQKPNKFVKRAFKANEAKRIKAVINKIYSIKIKS